MALYVDEPRIGKLHWPLILATLTIAGLGVWNLASASQTEATPVWVAQLTWLGLGVVIATISMFFDYRLLRGLTWPIYLATVIMLVLVATQGRVIMGAQRWLEIGPIRLQPSEFAKLTVILFLARYFGDVPPQERVVSGVGPFERFTQGVSRYFASIAARRRGQLSPPQRMAKNKSRRVVGYTMGELWFPFLVIGVPILIVIKQPDLGTGLVTAAVAGAIVLFAGLTFRTFLFLATTGAGAAVLAWFFALKPYQRDRVLTFLDPQGDAQGKGYHAMQSLIAVGSGRMYGKGWGNGTQNQLSFLPEQHTDFAFPVWAEEHGFVGSVIAVALFLFLVMCALDVAGNARDRFGAFLAFGIAALFFWHAFINIGMVLGVLPVVGVPLILFSYGGSSAILTLLSIGVLLNISLRRTL